MIHPTHNKTASVFSLSRASPPPFSRLRLWSQPNRRAPRRGNPRIANPPGDLRREIQTRHREMSSSPENPNWLLECSFMDEIGGGVFGAQADAGGCHWHPQCYHYHPSSTDSGKENGCFLDPNGCKESSSRKRASSDSCSGPKSKACREKMRRDRLNDKFMELGAILEPGKTPKLDKAAILSDAAKMVTQLRAEAEKLKESNKSLQEKIEELKTQKNELKDEKQRLKAAKEGLEQQIKAMNLPPPSFMPYPPMIPCPYISPGQAGNKLMMPYVGHPGLILPFQSPATVDDKNELPPAA